MASGEKASHLAAETESREKLHLVSGSADQSACLRKRSLAPGQDESKYKVVSSNQTNSVFFIAVP